MPTNYKLAFSRLHSTWNKAVKEGFLKQYNDVVNDQLAKGIIEEVQKRTPPINVEHYLPHFGVITPEKSTKLRVVMLPVKPTKMMLVSTI